MTDAPHSAHSQLPGSLVVRVHAVAQPAMDGSAMLSPMLPSASSVWACSDELDTFTKEADSHWNRASKTQPVERGGAALQ